MLAASPDRLIFVDFMQKNYVVRRVYAYIEGFFKYRQHWKGYIKHQGFKHRVVWKDEAGLCDYMGMKVTKYCMVMVQTV